MQLDIIHNGQVLRTLAHEGQNYASAPKGGTYAIRLRNTSPFRKLAVVSVDGINVVNGADAGVHGSGYVLDAYGTVDIPGWRRSDNTVAAFEFKEQGGSYAAQTGRGTSNVGVIGVAVFDERPKYVVQAPYMSPLQNQPFWGNNDMLRSRSVSSNTKSMDTSCSTMSFSAELHDSDDCKGIPGAAAASASAGPQSMNFMDNDQERSAGPRLSRRISVNQVKDVGTGYGREQKFATTTTTFERASDVPAIVLTLRYATRERLVSWGVPVDQGSTAPNPFPMSTAACPPPPGYRG